MKIGTTPFVVVGNTFSGDVQNCLLKVPKATFFECR